MHLFFTYKTCALIRNHCDTAECSRDALNNIQVSHAYSDLRIEIEDAVLHSFGHYERTFALKQSS